MAMQEPEITRTDPKAYYYWLVSQGMNAYQASTMVNQRFPKPEQKTPEQQQREAGKQQQGAVLAQTAGMVGGVIAGRYAYDAAENAFKDLITGSKVSDATVKAASEPMISTTSIPQQQIPTGGAQVTIDTPAGPQTVPQEIAADKGFIESANWGAIAQGTVALLQAYQAYKSYKSGDKVGAGISTAGAVTGGAAALSAAGIGGASTAAIGAYAPYAGIAGGAYGGYQTAKYQADAAAGAQRNRQSAIGGAASGTAMGAGVGTLIEPGVGTAIGAGVGAVVGGLAGLAGSVFGSSKDKYQMIRDRAREGLVKANVLDQNYQGTLADGSTFDFGKDGKKYGKLNTNDPNYGIAAGLANVIAAGEGLYGRPLEAVATLYANASMSNANGDVNKVYDNIRHFATQRNMNLDNVTQQLDKLKTDKLINDDQYNAYLNGARTIFGTQPQQQQVQRPTKGQVARVSPGMYMNDKGQVKPAASMRQSLEQNYGKSKAKSRRK